MSSKSLTLPRYPIPDEMFRLLNLQAIDFLCIGKVMGIQTDKGWCYIGCSKKLLQGESSFTRTVCTNPNVVASLRCRVELTILDETEEAIFAAFSEMIKLTTFTLLKLGNTWFIFN
uniref:Uncharacterized protein n=1 Tax=Brassica campestris TaxID=3711 RepID=M4CNV1_BRACM|nr:unnamed protein product [Brassica rapa]